MTDFSFLQRKLDTIASLEFSRKLAFEGLADNLRGAVVLNHKSPGDQVTWGHVDKYETFEERKVPRTKKSENSVRLTLRIAFEVTAAKPVTLFHYVPFDLRIVGDAADASLPGASDWIRITLRENLAHFATLIFENVSNWVSKQERVLFLDHNASLI